MAEPTPTPPAMPEGVAPDSHMEMEAPETPEQKAQKLTEDIEKHLKTQAEQSERYIRDRTNTWRRNIELRQGNPNGPYDTILGGMGNGDDYQSEYNPDWFLVKAKTAALFSQVPKVQLEHEAAKYAPAVGPFAKAINYELDEKRCNALAAMTEIAADVVNAAGLGVLEVGYAARFETVQVPAVDTKMIPPEVLQQMQTAGALPMKEVQRVADYRFFMDRFSPADVLLPKSFTGSDYNKAMWIGRRFKTSWAEGSLEYKLTDADKDEMASRGDSDQKGEEDLKTSGNGGSDFSDMKAIRGKRLYYWRYRVDAACVDYSEIWEIVWLEGKKDPVRHQRWSGQKDDPRTGKTLGARSFPIRVATTTYISDNPLPPSDSEAARPQVNDLRRSRSQMFQNREYSKPVRWFNTDRTDPSMHDLLMKGQMQGMIPVQGDGRMMIGEIARASYPQEDFAFDRMSADDLYKMYGVGPNQMGLAADHEVTAGEANLAQSGFESVIGQERSRIAQFFLGSVEVLAGLIALYSDFPMLTEEERKAMTTVWDNRMILVDLAFKILPDSQVVLDTSSRIKRLTQLLNITVKSGFVNPKPLIVKLVELHGEDPNEIVVSPQPHPMKPASVSFSFRGKDDLQNPMVVAILSKNGQFPTPEEVSNAQKMLLTVQSGEVIEPPQKPGMPGKPGQAGPHALPPPNQDHQPQWGLASKVMKRSRDLGGN